MDGTGVNRLRKARRKNACGSGTKTTTAAATAASADETKTAATRGRLTNKDNRKVGQLKRGETSREESSGARQGVERG